jgi:hypothetical protein
MLIFTARGSETIQRRSAPFMCGDISAFRENLLIGSVCNK